MEIIQQTWISGGVCHQRPELVPRDEASPPGQGNELSHWSAADSHGEVFAVLDAAQHAARVVAKFPQRDFRHR